MIKTDHNLMVIEKDLNKQEAKSFILFLRYEKERHKIDIRNINQTIKYLKGKFKL